MERMQRILIPVSGTRNCQAAVRHLIKEFMNNTSMEIHLLNVQPPFRGDVSQFTAKRDRDEFHREEGYKHLRPCREQLDKFSVPYSVHIEVGEKAHCIVETAHRLSCDLILMGTARKNSLTRLVENSTTSKVLELTDVPVEVITGGDVSKWERYGIPAAIGVLLATFFAVAD